MMIAQLKHGKVVNASSKPIEATTNRSIKVPAPNFTIPSNNFATLEAVKAKLATTHRMLTEIAATADQKELEEKGFPHPVEFKAMDSICWVSQKQHILQIKKGKQQLRL